MIDSVFQLLFRFEKPLALKQIGQTLGNPKGVHELTSHLLGDSRFIAMENDQWRAAPLQELIEDQPLQEVEFMITDLETTGPAKGKDRIIDIAAIKLQGGAEQARFESLVNPQIPISYTIRRLTGIGDATVAQAPPIETVLPRYLEFARGAVFVAHNAQFDFSFINHEIRRLGLEPMHNRLEICTLRLARRLLPEVKACGLNGLSEHFQYEFDGRHRAMPDVLATAHFLGIFLERLAEQGVTTLHGLINFQKEVLSSHDVKKKIRKYQKREQRPPRP